VKLITEKTRGPQTHPLCPVCFDGMWAWIKGDLVARANKMLEDYGVAGSVDEMRRTGLSSRALMKDIERKALAGDAVARFLLNEYERIMVTEEQKRG
jgi:hypothetical protein